MLLLWVAMLFLVSPAFAQPDPTSSTAQWVPILYSNGNYPDPVADQQTGSAESDIIGNANLPSFYMQYNSGYLGFRLRLGADLNPPGFKGAAFVGLDANLDGALDLFVGVNNSGSANQVGIWSPGTGLNTSPKTTTLVTPALMSYTETSLNYSFAPVTAANDPTATTFDLNADGNTDQFLTFYVPFADIANELAAVGINFTTNSPMQLVAATATQANSLNEDLNGVNGGVNSTLTWSQLGASSQVYSPTSITPVPEPATLALCFLAAALLPLRVGRRKPILRNKQGAGLPG